MAGLPANALCARQVAATTGRGVSTADGLVGRLSVHKVGVSCYSFHSGMRSGSADTSPRLSHDAENNCNVTHPTRLRYNRCKPSLGPRQRALGAAAPDAAVSEAAAYMVEAVATSMAGPPRERLPRTRSSRIKLRWVRDRGRSRLGEVRRLLARLGTHAGFTPPRNSRLCLAKALRS